jgi:hypothetical protein
MRSKDKNSIGEKLKNLEGIAAWFEKQEEVDVEVGLEKVKEARDLIKDLEGSLKEVENEFIEIKGEIEGK